MKSNETERLLSLLADANPKSVFLEVAFLESWVAYQRRQQRAVPLAMIAGALAFFEAELNWRPRPQWSPATPQPAWGRLAVGLSLLGLLAPRWVL